MARSSHSISQAAFGRTPRRQSAARWPADRVTAAALETAAKQTLDPAQARWLVDLWGKRITRSEAAHYDMAASYLRIDRLLSLAVVVLSLVTGSGIFATLSTSAPKSYRYLFGIISLIAAILAGISRSLRYSEDAQQNREAGARWAPVNNSAERLRAATDSRSPAEEIASGLDELQAQMDEATQRSPSIPQRFFLKHGLEETYVWRPHPPTARWWRRNRAQAQDNAGRPDQVAGAGQPGQAAGPGQPA